MGKEVMPSTHRYMKVLCGSGEKGEKVGIVFFSDAKWCGEMLAFVSWVFFLVKAKGQDLDDEMLAKKVIQHVLRQRL